MSLAGMNSKPDIPEGMVGSKINDFYSRHPTLVKVVLIGAGIGSLVGPVAAANDTVFGVDTATLDAAFDLMSQHIIPKTGELISAMPSVIIPLVILIVLIMILFIVPELLGTLIDAVRSAIGGAFHKSK
jgi:Na+/alanine symporter